MNHPEQKTGEERSGHLIYSSESVPAFSETEKEQLRQCWLIDPSCPLFQNPKHFCFNTDTALLAQFMKIHQNDRVLEIGCNNGALLLYADRYQPSSLTGVEILEEPARLAAYNLSAFARSSWQIVQADICGCASDLGKFDVILSNPPFFTLEESGFPKVNDLDLRKLGRIEANLRLDALIAAASDLLRSSGRLFLVHRPDRLMEILRTLDQNGFGLHRIGFVYDRRDRQCKSLLIEAVLDRNCRTLIEKEILI